MKIFNLGELIKKHFGAYPESATHPHVLEEKADLFSAVGIRSTELETVNFINALVYSFKPKLVLETGTHLGCGTIAIAHALEANKLGRLLTIEPNLDFICKAKVNVERLELLHRVKFIQDYSFNFFESYKGDPFDFVFFDSEASRKEEFEIVLKKNLFSDNAICLFHDTSSLRHLTFPADQEC
jgi:predicted O-methyltransferase YrrM